MSKPITLYDLRKNAGLTAQEVVRRMQLLAPETPNYYEWVIQVERRGTQRIGSLRALSAIYGVSLEEVEAAALNSRQYGKPETRRKSTLEKIYSR